MLAFHRIKFYNTQNEKEGQRARDIREHGQSARSKKAKGFFPAYYLEYTGPRGGRKEEAYYAIEHGGISKGKGAGGCTTQVGYTIYFCLVLLFVISFLFFSPLRIHLQGARRKTSL